MAETVVQPSAGRATVDTQIGPMALRDSGELVKPGGNVAFIKAGLQIRGVWQSGFMRRPLRELAADEAEEFERALAEWRHASMLIRPFPP